MFFLRYSFYSLNPLSCSRSSTVSSGCLLAPFYFISDSSLIVLFRWNIYSFNLLELST